MLAEAFTTEIEPVGIVDHAVEDGVRKRRDPDHVMPPINWNLACDDQGSLVVAVLDDFEKAVGLILRQGPLSPKPRIRSIVRAKVRSILP